MLAVSCVLFLFLFGPLFSASRGVIQGSGKGSKKPLKCWLLWEYFKRPFHHVHEAALETKLKYDLCETSINSLESFVAHFRVLHVFFFLCCGCQIRCLFIVLQLLQIISDVQTFSSSRKSKTWIVIGVNYVFRHVFSVSRTIELHTSDTAFPHQNCRRGEPGVQRHLLLFIQCPGFTGICGRGQFSRAN